MYWGCLFFSNLQMHVNLRHPMKNKYRWAGESLNQKHNLHQGKRHKLNNLFLCLHFVMNWITFCTCVCVVLCQHGLSGDFF